MADLPDGPLVKMNDVEVDFEAGLSEALFDKMGKNINGLIARGIFTTQVFTASGSFTKPTGVGYLWVWLAGGGGAGGAGGGGIAGQGGQGAVPVLTLVDITAEGDPITVTIGSGGASSGANGGNTVFGSLLTAPGANGGATGGSENTTDLAIAGSFKSNGGQGGDPGGGGGNSTSGQASLFAAGGVALLTNNTGGGGGGGIGAGGAGGTASGAGGAGGISAGGGGGGNVGSPAGGAGGDGIVVVGYVQA